MRFFWWFLLVFPFSVQAERIIQDQVSNSSPMAEARYLTGDANKPAILILHGFLATHQFPTIRALQDYFNFEGYTTLAPTLTLQTPLRKNSLNCNSLHTHTLQQDINEIVGWINWLEHQGHQEIILIGHSSGSLQLVETLSNHSLPSVKAAFLTSLYFLNTEQLGTDPEQLIKAKNAVAANDLTPQKYSFLYCQNDYLATPQSFLSYMASTKNQILNSLNRFDIPTYTVIGTKDERHLQLGMNWVKELQQTQTQVILIDGANHFFSNEHEAELQEIINNSIKQLALGNK